MTVAWVAILSLVAMAVASLGVLYAARVQAANAADAAALAAAPATYPALRVGSPTSRARVAAEANGAVVAKCECAVDPSIRARSVTVWASFVVTVPIFGTHEVTVAARAEFDPRLWLGR